MNEQKAAGNVTKDEVAAVVRDNELDIQDVSSNAVRKLLGNRGSYSTIQKFIDVLRTEARAAAAPQLEAAAPAAPADVIAGLWSAAWTAAQGMTLSHVVELTADRDALKQTAAAQAADLGELNDELDTLQADRERDGQNIAELEKTLQGVEATAQAAIDTKTDEVIAARAELERVTAVAAQAAAIAERDMTIKEQSLQSTIDSLTTQVGELKAQRVAAQSHEDAVLASQAAAAATLERAQATMQAQAVELAQARAEIARAQSDAAHQAELARRDVADAQSQVDALKAQISQLQPKT